MIRKSLLLQGGKGRELEQVFVPGMETPWGQVPVGEAGKDPGLAGEEASPAQMKVGTWRRDKHGGSS